MNENELLKVKTDNAKTTIEKEPASNIKIAVFVLLGIVSLVCGILMRIESQNDTRLVISKLCETCFWAGILGAAICLHCCYCLICYNKELTKDNNSENKDQE